MADKKTLVVYFSHSGRTQRVAHSMANILSSAMYELEPVVKYPRGYSECLARAENEKTENARPAVKGGVIDFDQYDRFVVGFPIWWYTCPMPVFTFFESYDFSGKEIFPFCTHGGGGVYHTAEDIAALCPGAKVAKCLDANRVSANGMKAWLGV